MKEKKKLTFGWELVLNLYGCNLKTISSKKKIQVQVEGAGTLQGFGSADPLSLENFYDHEIAAFRGRALAVIRHSKEGGVVKVIISADGCETVTLEL